MHNIFHTVHDNLCDERVKNFRLPHATCRMPHAACTACALCLAFGLIARRCSVSWPKATHQLLSAIIKATATAAPACLGLTKFKFSTQRAQTRPCTTPSGRTLANSSAVRHLCGNFCILLFSFYATIYTHNCVCVRVCGCASLKLHKNVSVQPHQVYVMLCPAMQIIPVIKANRTQRDTPPHRPART